MVDALKSVAAGSWRTTLAGVGTILGAVGAALSALFDSDPLTVVSWPALMAAVTVGLGLISARDNVVTSEAAGAAK